MRTMQEVDGSQDALGGLSLPLRFTLSKAPSSRWVWMDEDDGDGEQTRCRYQVRSGVDDGIEDGKREGKNFAVQLIQTLVAWL